MMKDAVFSWLVRNIYLPRNEVIDSPGFIILKLSIEREITNLREILLPESILIEFENKITKKYGDTGKQMLYSIGKKFGYSFALSSNYPHIKMVSEKRFLDFTYNVVRYLEAIYSTKISHEINLPGKVFTIRMHDYIVCNKNGLGCILADGSIAGVCAYGAQDQTIEGVQTKCQGKGDKFCEVICAPEKYLKGKRFKFFVERNLSDLEIPIKDYNEINKIRNTSYSNMSFKGLLDSGFFNQHQGIIKHEDERFLLMESSLMYILEKEIRKLKDGAKVLFDVSFDYGKNFAQKEGGQDPSKLITDLMGAFGWGDVLVSKDAGEYSVYVKYFPWNKWYEETDFTLFRGMISGILSGFTGKKVVLSKIERDLAGGYFSISISE